MFKILILEESLYYQAAALFDGYGVDVAKDEEEFLNLTYANDYDLYVINFYFRDVLEALRESQDNAYAIMVDEYYDIAHLKRAFLLADAYMVKPLLLEELRIRVDYYYRKLYNEVQNIIRYKNFFFHLKSEQLFDGKEKVKLSPNELKLLKLFLLHIDKPISKDLIYDTLESSSDGSLRVYVSKLNKLGFDLSYDRSIVSYALKS
jgi:DNA-binding response OmpR family regulator